MQYSLPRDAFEILVETFNSKEKAEKFAEAIEKIVNFVRNKSEEEIIQKKEHIKIELKEELTKELVTRELFEERFKNIDERFKSIDERFKSIDERFKMLDFKINILIALTLIVITFANPTFVELIKNLFK
jgi:DNA-directed RNA polymerase beta subunit